LIHRYRDRVYTIAYNRVRDPDEALDITQDTFLRMLEGLSHFREQANFYTWLHRIVINCCIDWGRRRSRRIPPLSLEDLTGTDVTEPADGRAAQRPHEALMAKELRRQIDTAIAAIPEINRTVVRLADLEGYSTAEIAQMLHCPLNTVKTRLHRGRLAVRHRLRNYLMSEV
jgi:RNA polymerase sigma-70 factor (ECF subfamily)